MCDCILPTKRYWLTLRCIIIIMQLHCFFLFFFQFDYYNNYEKNKKETVALTTQILNSLPMGPKLIPKGSQLIPKASQIHYQGVGNKTTIIYIHVWYVYIYTILYCQATCVYQHMSTPTHPAMTNYIIGFRRNLNVKQRRSLVE